MPPSMGFQGPSALENQELLELQERPWFVTNICLMVEIQFELPVD